MKKEKSSRKTRPKMLSNAGNPTASDSAKVVARVYVRPGEAKILRATAPNIVEGAKGAVAVTDPELTQTTLTKYSVQAETLVPIYEQGKVDNNNEVIERPLTLDDRVCACVLAEEGSSKDSKVVEEWSGPLTMVELCENSALVAPIIAKEGPKHGSSERLRKLSRGIDDEPVQATRSRARRRKPKENKSVETSCSRAKTDYETTNSHYPLHPCFCGIFDERAHGALPYFRGNLAKSKKVKNSSKLVSSRSHGNVVTALHPDVS
ncbi:hypothetical protein Aduo_012760 [Ancylostoma duodenale]